MVELTHNGKRYMVDGGQWYRRLEVAEVIPCDAEYSDMKYAPSAGWVPSGRAGKTVEAVWQDDYRVPCTDPRPPFVVGQMVKVARKDETCGYWIEDMDDLVGQSGKVFRYVIEISEQEVPSVKFDDGEYWNFPPWCLDAVEEQTKEIDR